MSCAAAPVPNPAAVDTGYCSVGRDASVVLRSECSARRGACKAPDQADNEIDRATVAFDVQILTGGMLALRMAGRRGNPRYAEPIREETGSDRHRRAGPYFKRNTHLFVGGEKLPNRPASERCAAANNE